MGLASSITQIEFAAAVGVHQTSVSAWEAGRQAPDAWLLRRICEALGVTADELLGLREKSAA